MQDLYTRSVQSQRHNGNRRSDYSVTYISAVPRTCSDSLVHDNVSSLSNISEHARGRSVVAMRFISSQRAVSTAFPPRICSNGYENDSRRPRVHAICVLLAARRADPWLSAHLHPTLALFHLRMLIGWAEAGRFPARGTRILLHRLQRCESGW